MLSSGHAPQKLNPNLRSGRLEKDTFSMSANSFTDFPMSINFFLLNICSIPKSMVPFVDIRLRKNSPSHSAGVGDA